MLETLGKSKSTLEYLGCSAEFFHKYIMSAMTPGMTIENIHIDHIKPVSKFNLSDEDEVRKCCHYTNLQPLLAKENLRKNNKWSPEEELEWNKKICMKTGVDQL